MKIKKILEKHKSEIKSRFGVKKIAIFGSCARGDDNESSDVDLMVDFTEPGFDNFMELSSYLEELFGKKVDILTPVGIQNIRFPKVAESIKQEMVYV